MSDFDDKFHTDLYIGSNATTVDVSFLKEGAGYKNTVGYYFYRMSDGTSVTVGGKTINTYDKQPIVLSGVIGGKDYTPTIIFPNTSFKRSGGDLKAGHTRRLVGNDLDGKFSNVNIGFFLIPNAWKSANTITYDNKQIIHSTPRMNHNWDSNEESNANSFIANPGYQTLLLEYETPDEDINVLCFEDISRPGGDKDFNDALFIVKIANDDNNNNQSSCNKYSDVTDEATNNGNCPSKATVPVSRGIGTQSEIMLYAVEGSYTSIVKSEISNLDSNSSGMYCLKHEMLTDTNQTAQEIYDALQSITHKQTNAGNTGPDFEVSANMVTITYTFDQATALANVVKGKDTSGATVETIQIQLLDPFDNYVDDEPSQALLDLQYRIFEDSYVTTNRFELIDKTDSENPVQIFDRTKTPVFTSIGSSMIWGDPHVVTIFNKFYTMDHIEGVFPVFENDEIKIRGEFWRVPDVPEFTYFKKIGVAFGKCAFAIDVSDFSVRYPSYYEKNGYVEYKIASLPITIEPNQINGLQYTLKIFESEKEREKIFDTDVIPPGTMNKLIRVEYGEFYIQAEDIRYMIDVQNKIDMNTKYLFGSNYRSKANGVIVRDSKENYKFYSNLHDFEFLASN